ncbi:MAG: nucleotidyltransferase family protein [Bacteroidales bacterium]|jgi:D-glycero-alpha-D-manno-heptose 1-phosphate guanylyltransferase|nr:nucleotidyltransferase family protein [Bacteroidales bacterium]
MDYSITEAAILVGGLGTRLKSVVSDLPKPMADVAGRPFLAYVLDYCKDQNIQRVVLCAGYKHEVISDYFGQSYNGMELLYSIEDEPLGTGGALLKGLNLLSSPVIAFLNGDSICKVNILEMADFYNKNHADIVLAVKKMHNFDRYGSVVLEQNRITKFEEKKPLDEGFINVGVMLINSEIVKKLAPTQKFSFEKDILENYTNSLNLLAFESQDYFIDIGIPEDYALAQTTLLLHKN